MRGNTHTHAHKYKIIPGLNIYTGIISDAWRFMQNIFGINISLVRK